MNCPKCQVQLVTARIAGIETDRCPRCSGRWLDHDELDRLEDTAFDVDEWKGTLVFEAVPTSLGCPKCGAVMKRFRYRYFELELEFCERAHGYWLDEGEEDRILEAMRRTRADARRTLNAEEEWRRFRRHLDSPGFIEALRRWLLRR
jgi:Zn-finger nucleic acid-binding protein